MKLGLRLFFATIITLATLASAQPPAGYYSSCEGKKAQALLEELHNVIGPHSIVSYSGLWNVYKESDLRSDGTIWDMYSTKHWSPGSEQCGNYSSVGDCYNREHSFPKSWFNDASPMASDAFHIYPTDGKVNGQRSNYPYGECEGGTTLPSSGGVQALGRLGTSTFPGYNGKVFEPDDEYKGDFARSYFYMAACYNDRIASWDSDMLAGNSYPAYTTWAVNLLLKWHRQDPVSQKETNRNNVIYRYQNNRNPFIDHPDLAEHIWGDKTSQEWHSSAAINPSINSPVDGSIINMGVVAVNAPLEKQITVKGVALRENVSVSVSGTGFSVSPATLSYTQANSETGVDIVVRYESATETEAQATLTVKSGDVSSSVTLNAKAISTLYALPATEIDETSFIANWVNVNTVDTNATYHLNVMSNGTSIAGFPIEVAAANEKYRVVGLEPSTSYTYFMTFSSLASNVVTVTTADPIPHIQFICDEAIDLSATIGEKSQEVEIGIDTWHVSGDITISAEAPFEVSDDKDTWAQSITLSEVEDHFYLRLRGDNAGEYTSAITATSATCSAEPLDVKGNVTSPISFFEDFETEGTDSYSAHDYIGDASQWRFSDAGIWNSDTPYSGSQAVRFGKNSNSYIMMTRDKHNGAGVVSFYAKQWSNSDGAASLIIEYSTDGGNTWLTTDAVTINQSAYTQHSVTINQPGDIRLKLRQSSGKRFMLDALNVSNHTSSVEQIQTHGNWTAYHSHGSLVIENGTPGKVVKIYNIMGETVYGSPIKSGTIRLPMPQGLYIVVIESVSRKVVVN